MKYLGVDTGGTFTDFVYFDGDSLSVHKTLSTPHAPEEAILYGIREMDITLEDVQVIHGSTVATNAVLEGKGVRTAYITNRGLGDILTIGRQARQALYDLTPPTVLPPVPQSLRLETGSRLGADGSEIEALTGTDLCQLKTRLKELKPDAVAINLLFSFLDDRHERAIEAIVPKEIFCSRSSTILPEIREYERGITTWLNSYVGPLMENYILRLQEGLDQAGLSVMQSHGGTISARQASHHAVRLLLSGPAGGLQGARYLASVADTEKLLTFDMGGTSTDVALIDGDIRLTSEGHIDQYPVAVPMVDMHTIGAGGGSIAYMDTGGMLQVGPESAGASPGPACYGAGGSRPAVTDANLVLGRLPRHTALGGGMQVDLSAAEKVFKPLAQEMGCNIEEAAQGVIRIANDHMAKALRVISVQRGLNPADYTLTCFGGAGGLHVCELAEALGMTRALIPVHAGVLSALGMLVAPASRQLSLGYLHLLENCSPEEIEKKLNELIRTGEAELRQEGVSDVEADLSLDLRYEGQSSTLQIPWTDIETGIKDFHAAHEQRFGHRMDIPVELVTLRVGLEASHQPPELPKKQPQELATPYTHEKVSGIKQPVPVYRREDLASDQRLEGPALITEKVSTSFITSGWQCTSDAYGNLLLTSSP